MVQPSFIVDRLLPSMTAGYPSIRWKLLEAHIYTIHPATRIDVRGVGDPAFADRNEGVTSRKGAQKQKMLFFNDVAPEHGSGFFHQKMGPEFFTRNGSIIFHQKMGRFHSPNRMSIFVDFSKELGPGTITIGTVLLWSSGFWDYRPDSVILRSKSDTSKF